ncbi:MAG: hypothetical protein HQL96_16505 [Magnetococcales bacterium]|nr:hypothetical protein [Magnetococcales bacterium]
MPTSARTGQRGAAMLLMMSVLVMAGLSFALNALLIKSTRVREDQRASRALAAAKEALLAYAVANDWAANKGRFPCPDSGSVGGYDGGGNSGACGGNGTAAFGLLPWKTLGLANLRDGDNAPILYAVSGRYKSGSTLSIAALPTSDLLTFNNSANASATLDYVAVLIAPGAQLAGQTRDVAVTAANQRSQFLEKRYASADTDFEVARIDREGGYNDRVIGITHNELIAALQ